MPNFKGESFPASGVRTGDTLFQTSTGLVYIFLGGDSTDQLNWRVQGGQIAGDPDTTGWTDRQRGAFWFNTTLEGFRGWNGDAIIYIG